MRLTAEEVKGLTLSTNKVDEIFWDDDLPGFGVRLRGRHGGTVTKRWCVQYRATDGTQRRESLGDVRKVKIDDARKIARNRFAQVELGNDPGAERAKAKAKAAAAKLTLAIVADRYLDAKKDVRRARTYNAANLHYTVHWKPLRHRPVDGDNKITRADVAARLQEITKEHGRHAAQAARRNLSALFSWAMREGLCEGNPVVATNNPAEGSKSRDRVLSDAELAVVWRACGDDDFGRIVKLLILLGCRREEIGGLLWSEVNFDNGVMTVPGERTKNHRTLELTLPAVVIEILQSVPRRDGRDYVFGKRGSAFSAWSYSTIAINNRIAETQGKPLAPWRLHDLRRTMRTGLGKLGVQPHIAEMAINHVKGGVEAIYDRHRYQREIKAALTLWAAHVLAIVDGVQSNVISLRSASV
jgi:integrase